MTICITFHLWHLAAALGVILGILFSTRIGKINATAFGIGWYVYCEENDPAFYYTVVGPFDGKGHRGRLPEPIPNNREEKFHWVRPRLSVKPTFIGEHES